MQRLKRDMLSRYEIPERAPGTLNAVQFGMGEALMGVADRLIDGAGAGVGIACLGTDAKVRQGADPAALLREQDGLYTVLVRGYRDDQPVRREDVVQCVLRVPGEEELEALAREPGLELGLIDSQTDGGGDALALAARLLKARHAAGMDGLSFICLGNAPDCAERVRASIAERVDEPGFEGWLRSVNNFYPALAEGFAPRADAREAARQCAEMNYADGMLRIAEPFARLVIQAPAPVRRRWPLDGAGEIRFVDDIAPLMARKRRLFDAGLFAMAAPGWLLGCDTLSDCMKHERLRAFVGGTYYEELLSAGEGAREEDAAYVIEAFERFENPLNANAILRAGRYLLRRFERGALPLMRAWAEENFEPPRRLSFALAATIMVYAGARPNASGQYEIFRGTQVHTLVDDPEALAVFATLSHDMPPEALAYAALADRELWHGEDLREIDGLEARVALDIANLQRQPDFLP